jgi:hypothetical protein
LKEYTQKTPSGYPNVFYVEIVDAIRINIMNEQIKWMRVADIPDVA